MATAGHSGDQETVVSARRDPDPSVRATALGAWARLGLLRSSDVSDAAVDPAPVVRRRACELAVTLGESSVNLLVAALSDPDDRVVEAACFALGEIGSGVAGCVDALAAVSGESTDPLCREAAVAALGAIGDPSGLRAILSATTDKPAVRRRAVLALAPFDGPDVEAALDRALGDRDWQVRQAAEDLTGAQGGGLT